MDLIARGEEIGVAGGFFVGCAILIRKGLSWLEISSFVMLGGIAATCAAGGAAAGAIMELILTLH